MDDFEQSQNPENCELITMNKVRDDCGNAWMECKCVSFSLFFLFGVRSHLNIFDAITGNYRMSSD